MELVLEMLSAKQFVPTELCSKTFGRNGGLIGRGGECDWAIPDRKRHLSKQHARVSYRNGAFYLTDTSSNGNRARISKSPSRKTLSRCGSRGSPCGRRLPLPARMPLLLVSVR